MRLLLLSLGTLLHISNSEYKERDKLELFSKSVDHIGYHFQISQEIDVIRKEQAHILSCK